MFTKSLKKKKKREIKTKNLFKLSHFFTKHHPKSINALFKSRTQPNDKDRHGTYMRYIIKVYLSDIQTIVPTLLNEEQAMFNSL